MNRIFFIICIYVILNLIKVSFGVITKFEDSSILLSSWKPFWTSQNIKSSIHCASTCVGMDGCTAFTFAKETKTCSIGRRGSTTAAPKSSPPFVTMAISNRSGYYKMMVLAGSTDSNTNGMQNIEIVDLESSLTTCDSVKDYPIPIRGLSGGFINDSTLLLCGGIYSQDLNLCNYYQNGVWSPGPTMLSTGSILASMPQSPFHDPTHRFYIVGYTGTYSQVLIGETWSQSNLPTVPLPMQISCMAQFNPNSIFVIGGQQSMTASFRFDTIQNAWLSGPQLQVGRFGHVCGRILMNPNSNVYSIIAVGGFAAGYVVLDSVEILDTQTSSWRMGPILPQPVAAAGIVSDPFGGVILVGGLSSNGKSLATLYRLRNGGYPAQWELMKQTLKTARFWPAAILIPDEMAKCQ